MKTNYTKLYKCQQGGMRVYTHACVCLLLCTHTYTYVYLHILFNSLFFAFFKSFLRHYLMDWTFAECQKFLLMLFLFCFSLIFFFSCIFSRWKIKVVCWLKIENLKNDFFFFLLKCLTGPLPDGSSHNKHVGT